MIALGLAYWAAPHPAWQAGAEPESLHDWPEEVGCVLYRSPSAVVLIDPLLPPGHECRLDPRMRG